MRKIAVNVFKFSELSDKAKEHARSDYQALFGYMNADEALESLKKLAGHFSGKLADYSIDWFACSNSSASFEMPELTVPDIRRRLKTLGTYNKETKRGNGECKLTGVCTDEDAIDGFRISFLSGNMDPESLMQAALKSLVKACQADCEAQYSDENFSEHCDANEYEFFANGEIVGKAE